MAACPGPGMLWAMRWHLHNDGSFNLITDFGTLDGAWPGIDHRPVRAVNVAVERHGTGGTIRYTLADGAVLTIALGMGQDGALIDCALSGRAQAPYWIHPICDARVDGFSRVFRQGQGFSGPTGFVPIDRATHLGRAVWAAGQAGNPWTIDSYILVGLCSAVSGDQGIVVAGPLDHRDLVFKADLHNRPIRGSFRNREIHENPAFAELGFRCENIALKTSHLVLPTIHVREGSDAFTTLRAQAAAVAKAYHIGKLRAPTYHYCSWYHKVFHFSLADVVDLCQGLANCDAAKAVQTVQIDDGYATSHGDWLTCKPELWPGGLEPAFRTITAGGRRAGVWVGPYMVGSSSRLAAEHPDWLLRWADGKRVVEWEDFNGDKGDFEHYVLDTSHPDAFAWIRTVFRTLYAQGARFFKTDFLEWGFKDSTAVIRHSPGKTSMQYVREMMEAIRADIGPEAHWLGCITYFAPMLGLADGMRVASDIGLDWNGPGGTGNDGTGGGTQNMVEESAATQYFNRVWWENDPDVVYLRDHHVKHEDGAWQALACWHGILGGSVNTSDEIHRYPAIRRAWWDFIRPGDETIARLPYFPDGHRFRVAVREYKNGWGVLLMNDRNAALYGRCAMGDLVGLPRAACFRWGPGLAEPMGELTELATELAGHRHMLVYVSRDGSPPPAGLTLGGAG